MNRSTALLAGSLIGLGAIIFVVRQTDVGALLYTLQSADPRFVLAGTMALIGHIVLKTARWQFMLRSTKKIGYLKLLPAVFAGNMGNTLIPHSGEVIRAVTLRQKHSISGVLALGMIFVERIFDIIAILFLLAATLVVADTIPAAFVTAAAVLGGVAAVATVVVAAFVLAPDMTARSLERLSILFPQALRDRLLSLLGNLVDGLGCVRNFGNLAVVFVLSLLQWMMMAICIVACFSAVSLSVPDVAAIYVLFLTVAGLTLPTAPGYVGTIQFCFVLGLSPFAINNVDVVAASVLYNAIIVFPIIAGGLIGMLVLGYSPSMLTTERDKEASK